MDFAARLRWRFLTLFRRHRVDADMAAEMRAHLEHRIDQNVAAGMPYEAARLAALRQFGGVAYTQQRCREDRGWAWLEQLSRDFAFGLRSLRKSPGFTATALLTLALGIGANTAVFSLVESVLLRPLPYPHSEQIASVWERPRNVDVAPFSWPELQDLRRQNRTFQELAGYRLVTYGMTGYGEPEQFSAAQVTSGMFEVMGLKPQLGQYFSETQDRPDAPGLAVLTDRLWRRRFGANPNIVGQVLRLDANPFTVIGVLPREFTPPGNADFVTQLGKASGNGGWNLRTMRPNIFALGRMKDGVAWQQALADLRRVSALLEHDHPEANAGATCNGQLLFDQTVGSYRHGLWLLLGAVALVLLIACANLASLMVARGAGREAEIAVKAALGAGRSRIAGEFLAESLLLASGGGVLGLALAWFAKQGIAGLSPAGVERFQQAGIDGGVLACAFGLSLATALLFGAWPAWRASRTDLRASMQGAGRTGSAGRGSTKAREVLIVAEVAVSLALLAGAGLLLKSFAQAQTANLGFETRGVLTARVKLPWRVYQTQEQSRQLDQNILAQLAVTPGVRSAAIAAAIPLAPLGRYSSYLVDGMPELPLGQAPLAELNVVSDAYFETLGMPLVLGRGFGANESVDSPRVAIVDREFAHRYWGEANAVGQTIRLGGEPLFTLATWNGRQPFAIDRRVTIVGIVPNVKLYGYAAEPRLPQVYVSLRQVPPNTLMLVVRGWGSAAALADPVRAAVRRADANQPISEVRTMEDRVAETFAASRLYTYLLTIFAGLALLLASVGLYGVLAYQVSQRQREFGIRLALGGVASQIAALVLRRGLRLIGIGVAFGLVGAAFMGRMLGSLLYRTNAFDGGVIAGVAALMAIVAALASWCPARRAARVAPSEALRTQ